MSPRLNLPSPSAAISMANFTTCSNCSRSEETHPSSLTCSWGTMWIVGSTASKHSCSYWLLKSDTRSEWSCCGATTSQGRLPRYTGSMMSASASTALSMSGNTLPIYLISCHWWHWSMKKLCAFTAACLHQRPTSMTLWPSSANKKSLTLAQCAISCGQTLMTSTGGSFLQEGLDFYLGKAASSSSTGITTYLWYAERINSWCKATRNSSPRNWWQCGRPQIIATGVGMLPPFSKSTNTWRNTIKFSRLQQTNPNPLRKGFHNTFYDNITSFFSFPSGV